MTDHEKLNELEQRITRLILKEQELRKECSHLQMEIAALKVVKVVDQQLVFQQPEPPQMIYQQPASRQPAPTQPHIAPDQTFIDKSFKLPTITTESLFGKNIMGVVASLLIFIGIVSFAVLIYDKIPDAVKTGAIFLLSSFLIGAGLYFGRKQKNPFSNALLGCGIGSMYLFIITLNVVFHYIAGTTVYIFLLLWVTGVLFIVYKFQYSNIFRLVCQLGVFFSIFLSRWGEMTPVEYILISIYTVTAFAAIEGTNKIRDLPNHLGYVLIAGTFSLLLYSTPDPISTGIVVMNGFNLLIFTGFFVFYMWKAKREEDDEIVIFIMLLITVCYLASVMGSHYLLNMESDQLYYLLVLVILISINLYAEIIRLKKAYILPLFIPSVIMTTVYVLLFSLTQWDSGFTGLLLLYLPMLYWGIKKRDLMYEIAGNILLGFDVFIYSLIQLIGYNEHDYVIVIGYITTAMAIGVILAAEYRKRTMKRGIYKCYFYGLLHYLTMMLIVMTDLDNKWYHILIVWSLLNLFTLYSGIYKPWDEEFKLLGRQKESKKLVITYLLLVESNLLYLWGTTVIWGSELPVYLYLFIVLVTVVHVIVRIEEFYNKVQWYGPFLGIKITLFVLAFVNSVYDVSGYPYVTSLLLIATAFLCILAGFMKDFASFRIYGLILTIGAVLKLVTYDISELNSMVRVAAFIAGGILCFAISLIYNVANKKIRRIDS
jgi:uncharacterized membrane protein